MTLVMLWSFLKLYLPLVMKVGRVSGAKLQMAVSSGEEYLMISVQRFKASELELFCVAVPPHHISHIKSRTLLCGLHEDLAPRSERTGTNLHSLRRVSCYAIYQWLESGR
jgi:hypothetical protein